MQILSIMGNLRSALIMIDSVAYSLIDDMYNIIMTFSSGSLLTQDSIKAIMNNMYIVVGIFALFRLAILLVNAIINPEKLTEEGKGLSNILANLVIMFVMLIMTPLLFSEAFNLQKTIIEGNYIQKLLTNWQGSSSGNNSQNYNPGDTMKSIAIGSVLTVNDKVRKSNCSGDCKEAIEMYDKMNANNNFSFKVLSNYIGLEEKVDGQKEWVYDYKYVLTFIVGVGITILLLSFAIDIAIRMIKLTVLEILAPLFIATYIDPKMAKSGPFSNWIKEVGKVYVTLFIRIAILSIMLLLISVIGNPNKIDPSMKDSMSNPFVNLFLMFGILIFAKQAPNWISKMIGVETDGNGFWSPKNLRDSMLAGGLVAGAGRMALGGGVQGVKDLNNARRMAKRNGTTLGKQLRNNWNKNKGGATGLKGFKNAVKETFFTGEAAKKNAKALGKHAWSAIKVGAGGIYAGGKLGVQAKDLGELKAKSRERSKELTETWDPNHKKIGQRIDDFATKVGNSGMDTLVGGSMERAERQKTAKAVKAAEENGMKVKYKPDGTVDEAYTPTKSEHAAKLCEKYGYDATNEEGICRALAKARIDSGELKGAQILANGNISFNGAEMKPSEFCTKNDKIMNNTGLLSVKGWAQEAAIRKAEQYEENDTRMADARKTAADQNAKIVQMKVNFNELFGKKNVAPLFNGLESAVKAQTVALAELQEAQKSGDAKKIQDARDNYDSLTKAVGSAAEKLDSLVGQEGTGDAVVASINLRDESNATYERINKVQMNLTQEIYNDMSTFGEDSYFNPKSSDESKHVSFMTEEERKEALQQMRKELTDTQEKRQKSLPTKES